MATTFAPINDVSRNEPLHVIDMQRTSDDHTPTTPRAVFAYPPPPPPPVNTSANSHDPTDAATPTRQTFGSMSRLPPPPVQEHAQVSGTPISRDGSLKRDSVSFSQDKAEDVEMDDIDDEMDDEDSDGESVGSDSKRPHKKKKGQRFFCTDFPPCQLSFTRSEHLARHIRKHTGERPFQCHCSRRFSRLDNLRQHAQTVHVNEEIPGDSLAATSTRFQRQIRTDRVRPQSSRSRASTINSQGTHSRGHSRNLSTSSIASTASTMTLPDDGRRRPQPLAMAGESHAHHSHGHSRGLSLNTYDNPNTSPGQSYAFYSQSPSGYSTPTSAVYSAGPGSPQLTSPNALARSSHYNGARHTRRLSVPSVPQPFPGQTTNPYSAPYYGQPPPSTSQGYSQNSSVYGSPTSSVFSHGRRDSETDLEFRRRTWHPSTYSYAQRPATSGLSYQQTPDDQRPESSRSLAASQATTRLPGIESFDHAVMAAPRHPQSSPLTQDVRAASSHRPGNDHGLHQGLTRLDITSANAPLPPPPAPREAQWRDPPPVAAAQPGYFPHHQHSASMPNRPVTPLTNKRQAWYGRPGDPQSNYAVQAPSSQRPSPEDSGSSDGVPTPSNAQGTEYHPHIVHHHAGHPDQYPQFYPSQQHVTEDHMRKPNYYAQPPPSQTTLHPMPAFQNAPPPQHAPRPVYERPVPPPFSFPQQPAPPQPSQDYSPPSAPQSAGRTSHDMGRLEALVAVATSEGRAAAAAEQRAG